MFINIMTPPTYSFKFFSLVTVNMSPAAPQHKEILMRLCNAAWVSAAHPILIKVRNLVQATCYPATICTQVQLCESSLAVAFFQPHLSTLLLLPNLNAARRTTPQLHSLKCSAAAFLLAPVTDKNLIQLCEPWKCRAMIQQRHNLIVWQ